MTCTCPNCGFDLDRLASFSVGELTVAGDLGDVSWRGESIHFSPFERRILIALVRGQGTPIKRIALAETVGSDDALNPENIVNVLVCRIRAKFAAIDPAFDRIETVQGLGLRWRA